MAFSVLAIVLCLVCPLVEKSQAEIHLMVQTVEAEGDKLPEIYCLVSDSNETVYLKYNAMEEGNATVIQSKPSGEKNEDACNYSVAKFTRVNGTGYYQCSTSKEHSLFAFIAETESATGTLSFLSCANQIISNKEEANCITCMSGNSSNPFTKTKVNGSYSQALNCGASKDGGASCGVVLPLRGHVDSGSVHVNIFATHYSYSFVCYSKDGPFEKVESDNSAVVWKVNKSANFEMNCSVKTPFGQAGRIRFEIMDYSVWITVLSIYAGLSFVVFVVVLYCWCKKQLRIRKMRHVYASFNASLSDDTPQRDLSRRPTRSLPPIPTSKTGSDNIHYANAHLRLSQNSMPARVRHSMFSLSSDIMEAQLNNRNSLPLHASNVSAQNALYFFTNPADDVSPKETTPKGGQAFTFPFTSGKPSSSLSNGDPKSHTINYRTSSLLGKRRNSDYQNWFQQYELSTSCPTIDTIEEGKEGKEPTDQLKSLVKIRHKSDRHKRRSLIRNRLSSACKDQTLPRRKLPSLSRPLSEYMMQPENPYVDRNSCYSK